MVNKKRELFAIVFFRLCAHFRKRYCWARMDTVRKYCRVWYGVDISERSASRYVHDLIAEGVFSRMKRLKRGEDGKIIAKSSLTILKEGAFKMVGRFRPILDALALLADAPKKAYNLFKKREKYPPVLISRGMDTSAGEKVDAPFSFIPPKFVLP